MLGNFFKGLYFVSILFCVGMIVTAIVTIFNPMWALSFIIRLCSVLILLFGVYRLFSFYTTPKHYRHYDKLFSTFIHLLIGVLMFLLPQDTTLDLFTTLIGALLIVWGAIKLYTGFKAKKSGMRYYIIILAVAAIALVAGIVLLFMPRLTVILFVYSLSAYVAILGGLGLYELFKMRTFFYS